ncbi:hypothetical protein, partial [Yersinia rochesterensis]|uniref:hypothetical protein n=1 Tax=Yersinia rochesterensis TaxID=1604335 RepID=UPI001C98E200
FVFFCVFVGFGVLRRCLLRLCFWLLGLAFLAHGVGFGGCFGGSRFGVVFGLVVGWAWLVLCAWVGVFCRVVLLLFSVLFGVLLIV